jgi:hypothetical protein
MREHELQESILLHLKMAVWQEHMAGNVTWAEIGMSEHELLESIL